MMSRTFLLILLLAVLVIGIVGAGIWLFTRLLTRLLLVLFLIASG